MTIEKIEGFDDLFDATCDQCGNDESHIESATGFSGVNAHLKPYGWVTRKIEGEWYNFCSSDCMREHMKG